MGTTLGAALETHLEDPLAQLPCSSVLEYRKGQVIYDRDEPSADIYAVIDGKVKVCRMVDDGRPVVVDIYHNDDIFGESAFLNSATRDEQALALDNTRVMRWTSSELQEIVMRCPRLALALLQIQIERSIEFAHRIESLSMDNIERRLARALIRFAERLGQDTQDGSVEMMPFTHEVLSQYVGASREIVTQCMNQFRRQGYLQYSRKRILLHCDAMQNWLRHQAQAV